MKKQQGGYYKRAFLNKPGHESIGFILAEHKPGSRWNTLTIGDCSRHIDLSLDAHTPADRRNTLAKLNLLIDTIMGLRNAIMDDPVRWCGE